MSPEEFMITIVEEGSIDDALDVQIRALLVDSFPRDPVFHERRWNHEVPAWRVCVFDQRGIVGQIAIHEKSGLGPGGEFRFGGIAEVCVLERARRKGLVRRMLDVAHARLREEGVPFAILFGEKEVYGSSGYHPLGVPLRLRDVTTDRWTTAIRPSAMYIELLDDPFPTGTIDLRGPDF